MNKWLTCESQKSQVKEYWVLSNPFWNHCCSILEDTGAREQSQSGKGTLVGVRGPTKSSAYLYWSRLELPTFHNGWWQYTRLARNEHLSLGPACVSWFRSMWYITLDSVDTIHHRDHILSIITVRQRSLRRLCFYTCLSFCPGGGGLQAHTQGEVGGLAGGGLQAQAGGAQVGGVSQHALKRTPPRRLLLQTVHILLECILVSKCNQILFATGLLHFLTGRAS